MNTQSEPVTLSHNEQLIFIEALDYPNPYDFHRTHRHDYFELIFIESGSGNQIIDFKNYDINPGEIYSVYPGQVHLMHRNTAKGIIIQFRKDIFDHIYPIKTHQLHFNSPLFKPNETDFKNLTGITKKIYKILKEEQLSSLSMHKAYSYLKILLISLIEMHEVSVLNDDNNVLLHFLSLVTNNITTHRKVNDYCQMLNCNVNRLNALCKNHLGKTPLAIIHEETLLEIRRLLLLNTSTLKEIAFELNFDSQANFSAFIKTGTGMTPTELQLSIRNSIKH